MAFPRWVEIKFGFLITEFHDLQTAVDFTRSLMGSLRKISTNNSCGKLE
ncbi:hypothetical protein COLO4_02729 [Corchorus olitorius]|uniref:Uncharacterized protein n=1 Tax=Corchorus olitorius TaxID=93759 RepID=A0A1R3L0F4_9ROSI|nr:hypothetical protein COLO4_02729 [Corchorus olitorius]